jgi:heme/copper-type cytochrome/quinol oxidase subunit 2
VAFAPLPLAQLRPAERFFRVEASQYAFTPAVLKVNPGDRVTIELASTDVVHGLYLDGYDMQVMADPGQTATLSFIANQSGMFRFRCSVTCGDLHPFMIGKLYVGPNKLFWRGLGLALLAVLAVMVSSRSE